MESCENPEKRSQKFRDKTMFIDLTWHQQSNDIFVLKKKKMSNPRKLDIIKHVIIETSSWEPKHLALLVVRLNPRDSHLGDGSGIFNVEPDLRMRVLNFSSYVT